MEYHFAGDRVARRIFNQTKWAPPPKSLKRPEKTRSLNHESRFICVRFELLPLGHEITSNVANIRGNERNASREGRAAP